MAPIAGSIGLASLLLASAALLSRVIGYVRDMVLAWQLGASSATDAYYAAFLLPDLLYYFLSGGAFALAFVPLYARHLATEETDKAHALLSHLVWGGTLVLVPVLTLAWWVTPHFVATAYPGFDAETQALTTRLTRIVLPGPLFFFLGGLLAASEAARKRFLPTALAPVVYNIGIVLGGVLLAPFLGAEGFAWGVLVGAVIGSFGIPLWLARKRLVLLPPTASFRPDLLRYLKLALPLMLGVSLITADEWFGRLFGATLHEGAISWLQYARRLLAAPVALLGMAVGQAMLPWMVDAFSRGETDKARTLLRTIIASIASLSVLAATALALLATPLVAFIYQRGAFTPTDTAATALALRWMSAGVVGWCLQTVLVRAYYARQNTWRPMILSTLALAFSLPVYFVLTEASGLHGLAAAGAIGLLLTAAVTAIDLHWRMGDPILAPLLLGLARGVAAAGATALPILWLLDRMSALAPLLQLVLAATLFVLVSLTLLSLLRDPAVGHLMARLRSRLGDQVATKEP